MEQIYLYDTTLRDGTQGENISFSAEEKLRIAKRLDDTGIHYVEGGWPGSNPKDRAFFNMASKTKFENTKIVAFSSTRRPGIKVHFDTNIKQLVKSNTEAVAIFGKTWTLHVTKILNISLEENLDMIYETVSYITSEGRELIYDAEHFFDGYKDDPQYSLKTLKAAIEGGAQTITLCDTNGGSMPFEVEEIVKTVLLECEKYGDVKIGIHAHNDCNLAIANTISGVRAGARQVQGTVNGYGERCGNADITSIIPVLKLKMGYDCISDENLLKLKKLSRFVSETANIVPLNSRPFVGRSAFTHKGGIHVSAIMKDSRAYEHINPELVGNTRRVLGSELSGKSNVEYKAKELNVDLKGQSKDIAEKLKELESQGFQFDGADGSLKILMEKHTGEFKPAFELESFRVAVEKDKNKPCKAHAIIKINVEDKKGEIVAAEGNGPVSALDNALRKALRNFFPNIDTMQLVDFKVRVIDGKDGTATKVRVLIESRGQDNVWSTIGVSNDIIEASWHALVDSFYYMLNLNHSDNV